MNICAKRPATAPLTSSFGASPRRKAPVRRKPPTFPGVSFEELRAQQSMQPVVVVRHTKAPVLNKPTSPTSPQGQAPPSPRHRSVSMAQTAINDRFSNMFKAFQHIDLNGDGTLDAQEIGKALTKWNIPADDENIQGLLRACDKDGNGTIDYKEFVDVLARDTVVPAAMGTRDMQAKDAMGVDEFEKVKVKNFAVGEA